MTGEKRRNKYRLSGVGSEAGGTGERIKRSRIPRCHGGEIGAATEGATMEGDTGTSSTTKGTLGKKNNGQPERKRDEHGGETLHTKRKRREGKGGGNGKRRRVLRREGEQGREGIGRLAKPFQTRLKKKKEKNHVAYAK